MYPEMVWSHLFLVSQLWTVCWGPVNWCVVVIIGCVLPFGWPRCHPQTLPKGWGMETDWRALGSKSSMNRLAIRGLMGEPMAAPMDLFIVLTLEEEECVLRQNCRSVTIWGMDIWVLWGSVGSCLHFCWTMLIAGSTGTEVNKALTSYKEMTSPSCSLTCCIFLWSVGCFWDGVEIDPPVDVWCLPAP